MGNKVHKMHKSDQPDDNRDSDGDKQKIIIADTKLKEPTF